MRKDLQTRLLKVAKVLDSMRKMERSANVDAPSYIASFGDIVRDFGVHVINRLSKFKRREPIGLDPKMIEKIHSDIDNAIQELLKTYKVLYNDVNELKRKN